MQRKVEQRLGRAGTDLVLALLGLVVLVAGCQRKAEDAGAYPAPNRGADCLSDMTLTDQYGHAVSLASLKGTPVLFDFMYTSCPGPCLMLTARMRAVADRLGSALGSTVRFVSVTVDPEHDRPAQLLKYATQQGANRKGWLFLTGTPSQIEQLMGCFKLVRQRESNGSINHVVEFFLVGADGHPQLQYGAARAAPGAIADDLRRAAAGRPVARSAGHGAETGGSRAAV